MRRTSCWRRRQILWRGISIECPATTTSRLDCYLMHSKAAVARAYPARRCIYHMQEGPAWPDRCNVTELTAYHPTLASRTRNQTGTLCEAVTRIRRPLDSRPCPNKRRTPQILIPEALHQDTLFTPHQRKCFPLLPKHRTSTSTYLKRQRALSNTSRNQNPST
ncbi:uncharacterized protein MYCGRDRAFT_105805 [Zymoseptoria tritici IPO323]|uniref:Uncharacterized protein n=1 Tax=Zymoseptoria tritici (strain CBS 115943 / IPO323) TaxID=336722 RepID=F9XKG2_ZYMTI|nr:uncharacterized protein MYCGRDRAFT_105805 [Zymoseptoria tritici IPO323]EGP84517.1 hypothetical protein MYCGRDRAFT_105805 [Zymoseptoria tritici IPO323]